MKIIPGFTGECGNTFGGGRIVTSSASYSTLEGQKSQKCKGFLGIVFSLCAVPTFNHIQGIWTEVMN